MAQIYLVRHGQASFGSQNYDQLSEKGMLQARALGSWWATRHLQIGRVVTGGMQRHRETAEACMAAYAQVPIDPSGVSVQNESLVGSNLPEWQSDSGLNEYHHHEVLARHVPAFDDPAAVKRFLIDTPNGKYRFQEIFAEAIARWLSGQHDGDYTETWQDFRARCVHSLQRQVVQSDGKKNIVIFTSGGTISAICQSLLGFPDEKFAEFNWSLVNAGVTRLHLQFLPHAGDEPRLALSYLNNFSHLEVLNQSEMITYV